MPFDRRSYRRLCVPAIALAAALVLPSGSVAADLVGTEAALWTSSFSTTAIRPGATVFNLTDPRPGSQLAAPADGVVTRWRTTSYTPPLVQLQIVRPVVGGRWQIVGSGPVQTAADAVTSPGGVNGTHYEWPVRLRIRAGDQLALHHAEPAFSVFFGAQDSAGSTAAELTGANVGSPAVVPAAWMAGDDRVIGLNADVEPDADGDGWGDETQDRCPGVSSQDQTDTDRDGEGDVCDLDDDNDDLPDADEPAHGTDPLDPDTDDDRLTDGEEVARGTDPTRADTDGDGLDDAAELALGTDPAAADSDADGVADGADRCPLAHGRGAADGCPVQTVEVPGPTVTVPGPRQTVEVPGPAQTMTVTTRPRPLPTVAFAQPVGPLKLRRPAAVAIELAVRGAADGEVVELLRGDEVLCRWTAAPYACTWEPDGAAVGRTALVAVVRSSSAGAIVASRTIRMGRFLPAGLEVRATRARLGDGRLRARATGTVGLPRHVTARQGCTGWATVRVLRRSVLLGERRARVDGGCRIAATLTVRDRPHARGRLRVLTRFAGNSVLTAASTRAALGQP